MGWEIKLVLLLVIPMVIGLAGLLISWWVRWNCEMADIYAERSRLRAEKAEANERCFATYADFIVSDIDEGVRL